jgi:uncharacterized protein YdeI (YjbR/CyaY-like superfamily)
MKPVFFRSAADFGAWLDANHATAEVLLLGLYKTSSGKAGMTYKQALDEALAYGWIDGVRTGLDEERYTIRFTPRRPKSIWSKVNIKRAHELQAEGRLKPAGLAAFEARDEKRTQLYSFENAPRELDPAYEKTFKRNKKAWTFYQAQAPWYRRGTKWWVMAAKKEETRFRRLAQLIEGCGKGERLGQFTLENRETRKRKK